MKSNNTPHGEFLYKYRPLDLENVESQNHVHDIVVGSKLYLSSPLSFNDPFDLAGKVVFNGEVTELRKRVEKLVIEQGVKRRDRKSAVGRLMNGGRTKLLNAIEDVFRKNIESTGVISLSSNPQSILMWSHYSNNHKGIAIQFDATKDLAVFKSSLKVNYSDDYPIIDWVYNFQEGLSYNLVNKFSEWQYEQEQRIIKVGAAGKSLSFDPKALTGIIIGSEAGPDVTEFVRQLIDDRARKKLSQPKIFKADKHCSKYQLSIREIT
jgi:hypothetical protein